MGTSEVQQTTESGDVETVREAIVMDTKEKKMHFLTTGQTIILTKQEVRVDSIDETKVKLVSGEETLTIE
jgi:co-chaperonin GroES (HSP10)